MIEELVIRALAGVGFAFLVQISPLGRLPVKPFSCRTCLSGWGAIVYGFATTPGAWEELSAAVAVLAGCFPAVALAHYLYAGADAALAGVRVLEHRAEGAASGEPVPAFPRPTLALVEDVDSTEDGPSSA